MLPSTTTTQPIHAGGVDVQQRLVELEQRLAAAEQRAALAEAAIQRMPICASIWHIDRPDDVRSLRLIMSNLTSNLVAGFDMIAKIGKPMIEIFPTMSATLFQSYADALRSGAIRQLSEVAYRHERDGERILAMQLIPIAQDALLILGEDITERKRAEQAVRQSLAQEETIRVQNALLAELSSPLIPISDRVMIMPLIGTIDSRRAQQVMQTLLEGVAARSTELVILDITGVALVDTQVANALIRAAQAVTLLGAQVVLTGIRPEVAQTLVGLGVDLRGMVTRSTLQDGIKYGLRLR